MLKRTLIIFSLAIAIFVVSEPLRTVHGIVITEAEWAMVNSGDSAASNDQNQEGKGNGLVRALKSPFKALGRLFGGGKKDKNKLQRISEKDAKRFENVAGVHVAKVTSPADVGSNGTAPAAEALAGLNTDPAAALEPMATSHLEKGRALLESNDLNGAISELSRAASVNPKLSEASSLLGVAYWRKGLRDLAERAFVNAVNIDKDNAQNLNNLGFLIYESGDYERATKFLKRAAKLTPDDARIWNNLGLAQSARGNYDDAFESFARAQGEFKGHLNVASRLEREGKTKKAIKHLEKAVAIEPNSPDVLVRLIKLYDSAGKDKQALSARNSLETLRTVAKKASQQE